MKGDRAQIQAFWFTVINYLGTAIGIFSTILIYPYGKTFYGKIGFIDSAAQILFPLMVFGAGHALIHFYPTLSHNYKSKLISFSIRNILILSVIIGALIFAGGFLFDQEKYKYLYYSFPMAIALAGIELFKRQAANIQRISIPTLYEKIIPKISLPLVFILVILGPFNETSGLILLVASFFLILLLSASYVYKKSDFSIALNHQELFSQINKKEYFTYAFYAFLASWGSFLAFRLDGLMIPLFLDFSDNGSYKIGVNLASAISVPATGLFTIYAPKVSQLVKENDIDTLKIKYRETAKLLFFIGAILSGCIIIGIKTFFEILPSGEELMASLPVIYVMSISVLINMGTGLNSEIIAYSKYYRFNIVSVLGLVLVNIILNLYILTQTDYGIAGVAFASLLAMVLFNTLKLGFIYRKFKILPFDIGYLFLFISLGLVFSLTSFIPDFENLWLTLIFKIGIAIVLSLFIVYKLKLIHVYNQWVERFIG
ncbi:polysaccharide biosynthesis C-terminal domain-containing protein [Mangrovivirga sp. M17]|uniref:Polysaccharide biosynthesis C-terminal domain-containing protein n=1 Tax=Mangrovivirga halotolerans TaxID=2993936 RepID=A0ABT3RMJ8_9BACT|nr:polysaccharide biosynthesis C-terminal domain-containing protein [Mangrovivirga halotolerans]MCX2743036.1 polysaccharide biosynthesis C-terminal domain-containing protein [Mangrovivirga halotolerans]